MLNTTSPDQSELNELKHTAGESDSQDKKIKPQFSFFVITIKLFQIEKSRK